MNFLGIMRRQSHGFWGSLVRKGTGVSSLNFYLIATTIVGIALLATVIFAIIWEVLHNDVVSSDISGWAAFVGAVGTLFASAGIAKGWSNWSENKFLNRTDTEETEEEDETGPSPVYDDAIDEEMMGDAEEADVEDPKPVRKRAAKKTPARKAPSKGRRVTPKKK